MSALGGILDPSGPDGTTLARLVAALAPLCPDGCRCVRRPSVVVVAAAADLVEHPPRRSDGPDLLLTWDGRLDRRDELARALGWGTARGLRDPELILRAYASWGESFVRHLEGDFALALWDQGRNRLLLARDPLAVRPLFYARKGASLVWASRLTAVRGAADLPAEIDEEWVAGYLASFIDPQTTPYLGIRAVPPGHLLIAAPGGTVLRRFWQLPAHQLRPGSDDEVEERFRALFVDAVNCRLTGDTPVAAELSGGLDSSSIVCVADALIRRRATAAPDLIPVSHVYERSPDADESHFIRQIEAIVGRPSRRVTEADAPLLDALEKPIFELPTPLTGFQHRHRRMVEILRENGTRVLLSGFAGSLILMSRGQAPLEMADRLRRGHLAGFLASLRRWRRALGTSYRELVWQGLLLPLLPGPLRTRLARPGVAPPAWLCRDFEHRLGVADRLRELEEGPEPQRFRLPGQRARAASVEAAIRGVAWLYDTGPEPIEVRYPFLDRRLVEFCVSLPDEQFRRPGETRSLHRRALAPFLPEAIRARCDKRCPDTAVMRTVGEAWRELEPLLTNPRVARRGWVDASRLRRSLLDARFGRSPSDLPQLVAVLALEGWLRRLEREAPASPPRVEAACYDALARVTHTEGGSR